MADTGQDLRPVLLDGRAAGAPAVASLAPCEIAPRSRPRTSGNPGGNPLDGGRQGGPVRFPGRQEAEAAHGSAPLKPWGGGLARRGRSRRSRRLAPVVPPAGPMSMGI